jgi:hypothetical protein
VREKDLWECALSTTVESLDHIHNEQSCENFCANFLVREIHVTLNLWEECSALAFSSHSDVLGPAIFLMVNARGWIQEKVVQVIDWNCLWGDGWNCSYHDHTQFQAYPPFAESHILLVSQWSRIPSQWSFLRDTWTVKHGQAPFMHICSAASTRSRDKTPTIGWYWVNYLISANFQGGPCVIPLKVWVQKRDNGRNIIVLKYFLRSEIKLPLLFASSGKPIGWLVPFIHLNVFILEYLYMAIVKFKY